MLRRVAASPIVPLELALQATVAARVRQSSSDGLRQGCQAGQPELAALPSWTPGVHHLMARPGQLRTGTLSQP